MLHIRNVTDLAGLKPDPRNARRRTDRSASLIAESLQRFGAARSIVIDEDGRILAGNGTVEGAKAAGISNLRIIESDGDELIAVRRTGLTEEQKVGLALADNRTSDLSEWDADMLQQLSQEQDLEPWFDADDLAALLGETKQLDAEGLTDPDDVPEPPAESITKPGDVWMLGKHRVMCGDSTRAESWGAIAMPGRVAVFTSPPYGAGNVAKLRDHYVPNAETRKSFYGEHKDNPSEWLDLMNGWCSLAVEHAECVVCNVQMLADNKRQMMEWAHQFRGRLVDVLVWDKVNGAPQMQRNVLTNVFEWCFVFSRSDGASRALPMASFHGNVGNIVRIDPRSEKNEVAAIHRAVMPCSLASWFLENVVPECDSVIDPFGGSGTTMIACEAAGKASALIEMDPRYCDVIVKRWQDFTGKTATLEATGEPFPSDD